MDPNDIKLNAVNWEHGMLLTPEHFLRQERYFDSSILWMLRYGSAAFGIVGGGPRLPDSERGAVRHDPVVTLDEDEESVSISVTQCRAITPGGLIIDVDPEHPLHRRFEKADLEGVSETAIYIICDPSQKQVVDGPVDEANPQMKTERRPGYRISLFVNADDVASSAAVAWLRRAQYGAGFEKDAEYIPPCTSLVSYSELTAAWRRLVEEANRLLERYTTLYRAMQEYMSLFRERGIETELDLETMNFVGRMVSSLQACIYSIIDPIQPPDQFFAQLRQFFHSASIYLDLSPPVKQYFDQLIETGESEYIALMEQQKQLLQIRRRWEVHEDLAVEVRKSLQQLSALQRLELALEGKYVDFRISPTLEAMNFIFDRGGKVLYKIAAKQSRMQGFEDELTIHFAGLRLEGRDKYRLILAGETDATFEPGTKISAEIRINEGAGFRREPIIVSCESRSMEQRNFEFDFEAPDVPTISDLRVSIPAHHPIRTALLFVRHRFYAARMDAPAHGGRPEPAPLGPGEAPEAPRRRAYAEPPPREPRPPREQPPERGRPFRRVVRSEPPEQPAPWETSPGRGGEPPPPGDHRRRPGRFDEPEEPPPPPRRRRRLE